MGERLRSVSSSGLWAELGSVRSRGGGRTSDVTALISLRSFSSSPLSRMQTCLQLHSLAASLPPSRRLRAAGLLLQIGVDG